MAYIVAQSTTEDRILAIHIEDGATARELTRRISKMTLHSGLLLSSLMNDEEIENYQVNTFFTETDAFFGAVIDMSEGIW